MPIPRDPTPVPHRAARNERVEITWFSLRQPGIAFFQLSRPSSWPSPFDIDLAVGIVLIRKLDQSFHQVIETISNCFSW